MKFLIRAKHGYGSEIRKKVISILEGAAADYTEKPGERCDFAIFIGGDGTLLKDHFRVDCPVLGINPGKSIGFYMSAGPEDFEKKILSLINGLEGRDYFVRHGTL